MRRREPGPAAELEALDPLTGESLLDVDAPIGEAVTAASGPSGSSSAERARRLRLVRRALVVGAVLCAGAAAYYGLAIVQLRGVERTWRGAMAIDDARAAADRQVIGLLDRAGDDSDDAVAQAFEPIGDEAAAALQAAETSLDHRRVVDRKVSDLRDQMIEALRFRRFQMSPQRDRLGNTPLADVERVLRSQLDRWDLDRARVEAPTIRALAAEVERLGRFADEPTDAILFAARGRTELLTVDVDAGTIRTRRLDRDIVDLFPARGGVAVSDGTEVVVYPPDPNAAPLARVAASGAVAAGDGTDDLWLLGETDPALRGTVRRFRPAAGARADEPIALPPSRNVQGAATGVLVLGDIVTGGLELWSLETRSVREVLSLSPSRFLDGEGDLIAWQGPLEFGNPDSNGFVHRMSVTTARRDLIGITRTDAASGVLSGAGDLYVAAGPLAGEFGSVAFSPSDSAALFGARGPRVAVDRGALALSADDRFLFWRTDDGAIAVLPLRDPPTARLLRTGLVGVDRLVAIAR